MFRIVQNLNALKKTETGAFFRLLHLTACQANWCARRPQPVATGALCLRSSPQRGHGAPATSHTALDTAEDTAAVTAAVTAGDRDPAGSVGRSTSSSASLCIVRPAPAPAAHRRRPTAEHPSACGQPPASQTRHSTDRNVRTSTTCYRSPPGGSRARTIASQLDTPVQRLPRFVTC